MGEIHVVLGANRLEDLGMTGNLGKFHVVLGTNRLEDSEMTGNWKISRRFRCKSVGGLGDDGEFAKIPARVWSKTFRAPGY